MATESDRGAPLPSADYFSAANTLVAQFDRLMVTIFSGLIAGTTVLLLKSEVSTWVGALLGLLNYPAPERIDG